MTRKRISVLVAILILSALAVNFKPHLSAQASPIGWRTLTGLLFAYTNAEVTRGH